VRNRNSHAGRTEGHPLQEAQDRTNVVPGGEDPRTPIDPLAGLRAGVPYSLRNAARLLNLPEGRLRRAILLEGLAAEEVADGREYVIDGGVLRSFIQGIRPNEKSDQGDAWLYFWTLALLIFLPLILGFIIMFTSSAHNPPAEHEGLPAPGLGIESHVPAF
jgi:hypothetical protein